jgi:UDP-N-acetylglucosamine 3-dehydrogenase
MVEACARAGVRLMVGHVLRFSSAYNAMDGLIRGGAVGAVQSVRMFRATSDPRLRRRWYADFDASGGPILDLMIHDIDVLRWYFGEIECVISRGGAGSSDQIMDGASAAVHVAGGLTAHLEASWLHGEFEASTKIVGSSGALYYDSEQATVSLSSATEAPARSEARTRAAGQREDLQQIQLEHFLTRLADGRPFAIPGEEAVHTLEVALAAIESARTRGPVPANGPRGVREPRPSR